MDTLFVSEPDPKMFGNDENPESDSNWTNANWLRSRFHFAFAEWRSSIDNFGILRVLNDDLVQPARGFGTHDHADMEIATIVLRGELTHKDSTGTQENLGRGSVQYMSAGYGVSHSESNMSKTNPLRFLQLWIMPLSHGSKPKYGGYSGTSEEATAARLNQWSHLVSWDKQNNVNTPIKLDQDVNIYVAETDHEGLQLEFDVAAGRQAYVVNAEGDTEFAAVTSIKPRTVMGLAHGEAVEVYGDAKLSFKSTTPKCFWVIVEMKWTGGKSHVE
jgi:redox-sensitive bicupin YhaK (pirin superfamily)